MDRMNLNLSSHENVEIEQFLKCSRGPCWRNRNITWLDFKNNMSNDENCKLLFQILVNKDYSTEQLLA